MLVLVLVLVLVLGELVGLEHNHQTDLEETNGKGYLEITGNARAELDKLVDVAAAVFVRCTCHRLVAAGWLVGWLLFLLLLLL